MKLFILSLLFSAIVSFKAGVADFREAMEHINIEVLNKSELLYMHEKLHVQEQKSMDSLELNPQRKAILDNIQKKLVKVETVQLSSIGDDIETINENEGIGKLLYQSDIVLTEWQLEEIVNGNNLYRKKRQAYRSKHYPRTIWPDGIVHFSFSENATNKIRDLFRHGALEWQRETCLSFYEYIHAPERIELVVEPGCWSYVGNVHKVQPLSLGKGCEAHLYKCRVFSSPPNEEEFFYSFGVISQLVVHNDDGRICDKDVIHIGLAAHEIGHALGFYHHHARHDRDEHLIIDETKVKAGEHDQFIKQTTETNDNYGLPYEYGSIMHYGSRSFSADKSRWHTMIPVDRRYIETLGSHFVSFYDKLMMNTHYNCLEKCKSNPSAAKCAMGGFPNPKDCSKCVCPGGYGGRLCNERPSGCGNVLQATTNYLKFEDIIGQSWIKKTVDNDFFLKCHYWIEAPLGRSIEVKFHNYSSPGQIAIDGCYFAGVEIKTQKDQRSTGYRFCSGNYVGEVFKSESNIVPIITYSRVWPTKTELWYRMA